MKSQVIDMKIMSFSSCRSIKRILTGRLIIACLLLAVSVTACAEIKGRKIGPVYCIDHADGGQSILSVIETKKDSIFHYHLQLNDSKNASLLKVKEIIVTTKQIEHEQIIGKMRDILWILNDSLTGYDARSLETVATENSMASMNSFMKNNFSNLTNNYLADEGAQVIYLTSANGEGYKLYPNFIILPDSTISDKAPENFSYEIASDYKIYGKFNMKYALSCIDTLADRLYIIGDETETKEMLSDFGSSIYPERVESREVTFVPLIANTEKIDFANSKPTKAPQQYMGGAFLCNKLYTTVWHGHHGEHLILYHSDKEKNDHLCVAMIEKNGEEKWRYNTGILYRNFNDYVITEDTLILWMDGQMRAEPEQSVLYILLKDGKALKQ